MMKVNVDENCLLLSVGLYVNTISIMCCHFWEKGSVSVRYSDVIRDGRNPRNLALITIYVLYTFMSFDVLLFIYWYSVLNHFIMIIYLTSP